MKTEIKTCTRCLMPSTRPGLIFNKDGVCQACLNYDNRKNIDWNKRKQELVQLCEKHKRTDGYYDCIVAVSGGKDSHYQVWYVKEILGMNPLLVTVGNPFTNTKAGDHNFKNIGEVFGCDHLLFNMSSKMLKPAMRVAFEEWANPLTFIETSCYTVVQNVALNYGIPIVFFGEDPEYEYGTTPENKESANEYIKDGIPYGIFKLVDFDFWAKHGVPVKELNAFSQPSQAKLDKLGLKIIFMSHYLQWDAVTHLTIAKRFGFHDLAHEWNREGYIENFEQIDSIAYLVHFWLKYPKFGFQRITDVVSRRIRWGLMSKAEGWKLIHDNDPKLDQRALDDFCQFTGYTNREFFEIVDKFYNPNIFEKVDGVWLKKI